MRTPAVLLGFTIATVAFNGFPLLAFVVLVGYAIVDFARYLRVEP